MDLVRKRLNNVDLRLTDDAVRFIAHEGYDPQFGARPVKRVIQNLLLNELSKRIIAGQIDMQQPIIVSVKNNQIVFDNK